jgi:riboflavin kinase/FMN adenylyltransferase
VVESAHGAHALSIVGDCTDHAGRTLGSLRQQVERVSALDVDVLWLGRSLMRAVDPSLAGTVGALHDEGRVQSVVVGADEAALVSLLRARRVPIEIVPPAVVDGIAVTSDAIRRYLAEGNLARVEQLLGRCYAISGRVVHGMHRGRQLGFPTANVRVVGLELPPNGVYAVRFRCQGRVYNGVANLGLKPTFADVERSLEAHVFDFDGDLYGRYAEVAFVAHLRGEQKYPSAQALIEQIRIDCAQARRRLL